MTLTGEQTNTGRGTEREGERERERETARRQNVWTDRYLLTPALVGFSYSWEFEKDSTISCCHQAINLCWPTGGRQHLDFASPYPGDRVRYH